MVDVFKVELKSVSDEILLIVEEVFCEVLDSMDGVISVEFFFMLGEVMMCFEFMFQGCVLGMDIVSLLKQLL